MEPWIQMVVTIVCSVIASSGFWAFVNKRSDSRDVKTEMLVGLAHDRIVYLGMMYIDRGPHHPGRVRKSLPISLQAVRKNGWERLCKTDYERGKQASSS